jgi:crotonobetainyl-CoA:carnitine CoA-transferase CaiB-like acyl-CoA transferase
MANGFLPLVGTRVVDVTSSLAGPYCTEILGALGADVVKVERPGTGDETRAWGPPFWNGESTMFLAANASKRSLALDLRRPGGREALLRLAERADVFVQSLRPGVAERRGLGPDDVRARNPRLVYASIGAFGRVGPRRLQPGYDPLMQAAAGIVSLTGEADRPGVRAGVSVVDQGTGLWTALGILAALLDGGGRVVDVSLYETALGFLPYQLTGVLAGGGSPGRHGTAFPSLVPYQAFRASDGELMLAAANDRLFASLCAALGMPGLAADPRFVTNPARVAHRDELIPLLAERLAEATVADWLERLDAAGVPAAPVRDLPEVLEDEQTRALGIVQPLPHPAVPELATVAPPLSVDGARVVHRTRPPLLGEHSAAVLAEAGYSAEEVEALAAAGVVELGNRPAR